MVMLALSQHILVVAPAPETAESQDESSILLNQ